MLLSKQSIRRRLLSAGPDRIVISSIDLERDLQPCSVDLYLGERLKLWTGSLMDPRRDSSRWWQALEPERDADGARFWDVKPGRFYLGVLAQRITLPLDLAGTLTGCSSEARCGYVPHQQAGHFDPGWDGYGTLELTFLAAPSLLFVGQRIAQMKFELLDEPVAFEDGYAGRYQGDQDAQPARLKVLTAA